MRRAPRRCTCWWSGRPPITQTCVLPRTKQHAVGGGAYGNFAEAGHEGDFGSFRPLISDAIRSLPAAIGHGDGRWRIRLRVPGHLQPAGVSEPSVRVSGRPLHGCSRGKEGCRLAATCTNTPLPSWIRGGRYGRRTRICLFTAACAPTNHPHPLLAGGLLRLACMHEGAPAQCVDSALRPAVAVLGYTPHPPLL
jgi:hypothetical protein